MGEGLTYRIVTNDDIPNLEMAISELMRSGWIPQGGICVLEESYNDNRGSSYCFYQAVMKPKPPYIWVDPLAPPNPT